EPAATAGQSGAAARSSKARRVIDASLEGCTGSSCPEARASVLDGSDTKQLPEPAWVDEGPGQPAERPPQRPRGPAGHAPELTGEVRLVDVFQLGRETGPARLGLAEQQRRLNPENGGERSRGEPDLAEERALQRPFGGASGRPERMHGDPSPGAAHRLH